MNSDDKPPDEPEDEQDEKLSRKERYERIQAHMPIQGWGSLGPGKRRRSKGSGRKKDDP